MVWEYLIKMIVQVETGCWILWVWGFLSRCTGHGAVSCCLFIVCAPLRDFRKVHSQNLGRLLVWKSCHKNFSQPCNLGGAVFGNYQSGTNGISQVNGELWFGTHLHQAVWVEAEFNRGTTAPCQHFCPGDHCPTPTPPALTLKLLNLVPSCMSLVFFKLLLLHLSLEWVSLWMGKSMYEPLKRNSCVSSSPLSHSGAILSFFHSQML